MPSNRAVRKLLARDLAKHRMTPDSHRLVTSILTSLKGSQQQQQQRQQELHVAGCKTSALHSKGHVYPAGMKPKYMDGKLSVDPMLALGLHTGSGMPHSSGSHGGGGGNSCSSSAHANMGAVAAWEQVDPSAELTMAVTTFAFRAFIWATERVGLPCGKLRIRSSNFQVCAWFFAHCSRRGFAALQCVCLILFVFIAFERKWLPFSDESCSFYPLFNSICA